MWMRSRIPSRARQSRGCRCWRVAAARPARRRAREPSPARREQLHDDGQPLDPDGRDRGRDRCRHLLVDAVSRPAVPPRVGARRTWTTSSLLRISHLVAREVADTRRRGHAVAVRRRRVPRLPHRSQRHLHEALRALVLRDDDRRSARVHRRAPTTRICCCSRRGRRRAWARAAMTFLKPTSTSTNTQVDAPTGCGMLDFSADLASLTKLPVPAAGPWVLDWRDITRDGQGSHGSVPEDRRRHDRLLRRDDRRRSAGAHLRHRDDRDHAVGLKLHGGAHRGSGDGERPRHRRRLPGLRSRRTRGPGCSR